MALAIGTRLGTYKVLSAIGAGGMGEVYRALDASAADPNVAPVSIDVVLNRFTELQQRAGEVGQDSFRVVALRRPK